MSRCACGHDSNEHGLNDEFPNSTECSVCPDGDCIAFDEVDSDADDTEVGP